jgi:hypothetical protein
MFAPDQVPAMRQATEELCWLLSRGYVETSALKLVGDRHGLRARQRQAVSRSACTDEQRGFRRARRTEVHRLRAQAMSIDAFNVLISLEAWLSGGVLLRGRDGALRDLASVHGSYRSVKETEPALQLLAQLLKRWAPSIVTVLFDRPVSNSGRIAALARAFLDAAQVPAQVRCVPNPDPELVSGPGVVASADRWVLDRANAWIDLPGAVIEQCGSPEPWLIDLT